MISRIEFFELTGTYPEDMFGGDWENEVEELAELFEEQPANENDKAHV